MFSKVKTYFYFVRIKVWLRKFAHPANNMLCIFLHPTNDMLCIFLHPINDMLCIFLHPTNDMLCIFLHLLISCQVHHVKCFLLIHMCASI